MTDLKQIKAGAAAVDPDDFNALVDAVIALQAGGGGGLPDEWTVADDGSLTVTISDAGGNIFLRRGSASGSSVELNADDQGAGVESAGVFVSGKGGGASQVQVDNGSVEGTSATLDGRGGLSLFTEDGYKGIDAWDDVGNTLRFALLPAGQVMTGVVAAPADGDLSASQVALWFDDTDGAAKLMVKGKSADGTVVTGALPLV